MILVLEGQSGPFDTTRFDTTRFVFPQAERAWQPTERGSHEERREDTNMHHACMHACMHHACIMHACMHACIYLSIYLSIYLYIAWI